MFSRFVRDRRAAQSGATLIEMLVSVAILGLSLSLIVGTLSTGVLNAVLAKRNTAAQAVVQYELDEIQASSFTASASAYSQCFATEDASAPVLTAYQASCPSPNFTLRADVSPAAGPTSTRQTWTITVTATGTGQQVGPAIQVVKVNR